MAVLVQELSKLYTAYEQERPSVLPALPIHYSDFARWQRGAFPHRELDRQLHYWKTKLAGIPAVLELPSDRVRPSEQTFSGATLVSNARGTASRTAQVVGSARGNPLFMVLLASFSVLLHR